MLVKINRNVPLVKNILVVVVAVVVLPGVIDVDILDLIVQVCLQCGSEEAATEDGGGSACHSDGEATGPRQPLHCRAC